MARKEDHDSLESLARAMVAAVKDLNATNRALLKAVQAPKRVTHNSRGELVVRSDAMAG